MTTLSGIEDVDIAATIGEAQLQEAAYRAHLGPTANLIPPSLADFLR